MEIETVLCVGVLTATYLTETNRVRAAIDLLKECLIFFENKAQKKGGAYYMSTVRLSYEGIYSTMYGVLWCTDDLKSAIECGRKLQTLLRESGKKRRGGWVTLRLGALHHRQDKYQDAKELYLEALGIMIETGDAKGELLCSIALGKVLASLGEFAKARPYLEEALRRHVTRSWEECLSVLMSITRLKNVTREHLTAQRKLATTVRKPPATKT